MLGQSSQSSAPEKKEEKKKEEKKKSHSMSVDTLEKIQGFYVWLQMYDKKDKDIVGYTNELKMLIKRVEKLDLLTAAAIEFMESLSNEIEGFSKPKKVGSGEPLPPLRRASPELIEPEPL